jgi:hypothetical protein
MTVEFDVLIEIQELAEFDRLEIEHFFLIYKELERGKSVEGASWAGAHRRRSRGGSVPAPPAGDPGAGLTRMLRRPSGATLPVPPQVLT